MSRLLLLAVTVALLPHTAHADKPTLLAELKRLAKKASVHPKPGWVKDFLAAAEKLPPVAKRVFFHDAKKTVYYTEAEAAHLPAAERAKLTRGEVDEETYYARIADPLGYLRPLEILAEAGFSPDGKRLCDFGYGNIGQLKMLAALGAHTVGVEVDPLLPKLYAADVGKQGRGEVQVVHGYYPTDPKVVTAVGSGYDLFLSKNTLKHGYVHPEIDAKQHIDLGPDADALKTIHDALKPGGLFFIYNFGPAQTAAYQQMADIRSPFDRRTLEHAGFEVLAFDVEDTTEGRKVASLLEWDKGPDAMPLEQLFARYTLCRRR